MTIPKNIKREHILKAIDEIRKSGIPPGRSAKKFVVIHKGDEYPAKYLLALANKYANQVELDPETYSGGDETNTYLRNLGFQVKTIGTTNKNTLNEEKFAKHFESYLAACENTDWLKNEVYKFRFARWLHKRVNLSKQSDEEILKIFIESQEQQYEEGSNVRGVNFILSAKKYRDEFITIKDISLIRKVFLKNDIDPEDVKQRGISFPKLSVWLAIILPQRFNTYAKGELIKSMVYLFDLGADYPKRDFKAFQLAQTLLGITRQRLMLEKEQIIPVFKRILGFDEIKDTDWVWITQDFNLFVLKKLGEKMEGKNVWIEKTYVTGVSHRESGDRALGKAIWSPRKSQDGKDIYKNMTLVSKGDVIIHLIDNNRISGVSIVKSDSYIKVPGLADSEWSGPAYLLELRDFTELKPAIETNELLNESNEKRLQKIKNEGEVFFTSKLELRQGAHLTPCNKSLLTLINEVYREKAGENLPHISSELLEITDDIGEGNIKYFWITANPKIWRVSSIFHGGEIDYTAINKSGNKRRIYSAFEAAKPGDRIVFYESTPIKKVNGIGTIIKGLFKGKEPGFSDDIEKIRIRFDAKITELTWDELKSIPALADSEPIKNGAQGSLFHLTKEEFDIITSQVEEEAIEQFFPYEELAIKKLQDLSQSFKIKSLYFENPDIIEDQIANSLSIGKHLILIGPPGTGKSKLAKEICEHYVGTKYILSTASSDWSTFDTIGGYLPDEKGNLSFNPGLFLRCLQDEIDIPSNCWLIIDEINRADIDKAFGALFSALTGDSVTLSYSRGGNPVQVIGDPSSSSVVESHKYYIHPDWRIIATMNTFDKASLYEMSYAFMRRFAFIPIDVSLQISKDLIAKYLEKWNLNPDKNVSEMATKWNLINKYRKIGPAIVHDMYLYLQSGGKLDSCIIQYVLPQFEGIEREQQIKFIKEISDELGAEGKNRLIHFASDFFDIDLVKFDQDVKD